MAYNAVWVWDSLPQTLSSQTKVCTFLPEGSSKPSWRARSTSGEEECWWGQGQGQGQGPSGWFTVAWTEPSERQGRRLGAVGSVCWEVSLSCSVAAPWATRLPGYSLKHLVAGVWRHWAASIFEELLALGRAVDQNGVQEKGTRPTFWSCLHRGWRPVAHTCPDPHLCFEANDLLVLWPLVVHKVITRVSIRVGHHPKQGTPNSSVIFTRLVYFLGRNKQSLLK